MIFFDLQFISVENVHGLGREEVVHRAMAFAGPDVSPAHKRLVDVVLGVRHSIRKKIA